VASTAFGKNTLFTSKLDLNLRKKLVNLKFGAHLCMALKLDTSECRSDIPRKFEMWCWRRMEKISWADRVRNEELLQRI
jgi:hypothetical protein